MKNFHLHQIQYPSQSVKVYKLSGCGFGSCCWHLTSDIALVLSKVFLNIEATVECGFTLKCVHYMIRIYSQMHRTSKYSQHSPIIWPVWPNDWVFFYKLSGCGFESSCSHLNFRYTTCFEQGVPWHSANYRVWSHSETRTWHDRNIQSNAPYR